MATHHILIRDLAKHQRRLGERFRAAMRQGLLAGAQRCIQVLQRSAETARPASEHGAPGAYSSGNYRGRFRAVPTDRGAEVFNEAGYAGVIEKGRRPGSRMPNKEAIARWAQRRLGLSEKDAREAAYPIARAIARRGLRPRRVFSSVESELRRIVKQEAQRAIEAAL